MNRRFSALVPALIAAAMVASPVDAQHGSTHARSHAEGAHGMVQQFALLADGGTVAMQSAADDAAAVGHIRDHLLGLALAFGGADGASPAMAHFGCVPGADVMAARSHAIDYVFSELPRGGEIRIMTQDAESLQAVHEFLSFVRDHHEAATAHGDRQHHANAEHGSGHEHTATQHDGMQHGPMHQLGCAATSGAHHGGS